MPITAIKIVVPSVLVMNISSVIALKFIRGHVEGAIPAGVLLAVNVTDGTCKCCKGLVPGDASCFALGVEALVSRFWGGSSRCFF